MTSKIAVGKAARRVYWGLERDDTSGNVAYAACRDEEIHRMSMDSIAERMRGKVEGSGFDKSVKFDCGDDGVVVIDGTAVTTEDQSADCVVTLAKDDLESMMAGDLDPTSAFMQGKIKVDGDMSVAMQLGQVI